MKRVLMTVFMLCTLTMCTAQKDSLIKIYIYDKVYKNIAAYNLRNAEFGFNGITPKTYFEGEIGSFFFEAFLAGEGYKLQMLIEKKDWLYPLEEYSIYRIYLLNFIYTNERDQTSVRYFSAKTVPDFLVAVKIDSERPKIKFLSGQFYLHNIASDFGVDLKDSASCIRFLKFKLYAYGAEGVHLKKAKKKKAVFNFYSTTMKKKMVTTLYKKNLDVLTIRSIE